MNKDTERAFDVVCRAIKHNRYMVHTICAAYLGCDPDDVVIRCRKKNGGCYAKENFRDIPSAGTYKKDG